VDCEPFSFLSLFKAPRVSGNRAELFFSLKHFSAAGMKKSVILTPLASLLSFDLLQFLVGAQALPNCGRGNGQQNDDGEADNKGEAIGKQDHS
jgi:hypothetical protein